MSATSSIHFQRRWFYVLWCALLAAALGALHQWLTPMPEGTWTIQLDLELQEAPQGLQMRAWLGPESIFRRGQLPEKWNLRVAPIQPGRPLVLRDLTAPLLRRRWTHAPYPDRNGEVLVLEITQQGGPSRYITIPMKEDLWQMLPRRRRIISFRIGRNWAGLPLEPTL